MPIIRREFLGILRSRRGSWISLLTVLATGIVPVYSWPDPGDPMPFQAAIASFGQYREVFFLVLFLFVPAVAGSAITVEREAETFDLLASSIPHTFSIALGKLLASTLFFLLLLVLTFPMVLKLLLLGGTEIEDFLLVLLSLCLFVLIEGTVALAFSFQSLSTARALMKSYAVCFFFYLFCNSSKSPLFLEAICVVGGLRVLRNASRTIETPRRRLSWDEVKFTRKGLQRLPPRRTSITEEILATAWTGIPDGWNPIFLAAVRGEAFGNRIFQSSLFWISGLAILFPSIAGLTLALKGNPLLLAAILLAPTLLFFPAAGVLSLMIERAPGRLDLLRITPLTAGQIIRGKLYAILYGGLCFLFWDLVVLGIFWLFTIDRFSLPHIDPVLMRVGLALTLGLLPAGIIFGVLAASFGLYAAAVLRKTVPALVLAYLLDLLLVAGLSFLFSPKSMDTFPGSFREAHTVLAIIAAIIVAITLAGLAGWIFLRRSMTAFESGWLRD